MKAIKPQYFTVSSLCPHCGWQAIRRFMTRSHWDEFDGYLRCGQCDKQFKPMRKYEAQREQLLKLLDWTPYGPKDVAEAIESERSQVSAVLHGHKTSSPMLDRVEGFLKEIADEQPDLELELD